jgi:outer membrane receptor protein involved in Fe transport
VLLKSKFILSLAGLLTALALPVSAALAAVLEEVIVTSERREQNLQDVPIAVSALNMDQLGALQVNQANDLQRYVPSLNMFNNITHPSNLSLSMRGGLQQDASLVVAESPIGIYVDDIYVARLNGNNVTLSDIERPVRHRARGGPARSARHPVRPQHRLRGHPLHLPYARRGHVGRRDRRSWKR